MEFEEACSEMSFIIAHMEPSLREKIPNKLKEFFEVNKSMFYKVNLTTEKSLEEQELKDETKAFIEIIKEKYLSKDIITEQMQDFKIEKQEIKEAKSATINKETSSNEEIALYKDKKIVSFFRKILEFFKKKN